MALKFKEKSAVKNWAMAIGSVLMAVVMCVVCLSTVAGCNNAAKQYEEQILQLESAVSSMASERDAANSSLTHMSSQIADKDEQLASASSQLESQSQVISSQSQEIKKKDKTIKSLKTRISLADAGKTTIVTRDQALPDRDYPDYTGKKLVALTFDDGPGKYTERLLNEMKKRGVKATFFVQGQYIDRYPKLIKRMEAEGHCVGNHSYSHPDLSKKSLSGVRTEMEKTANKVYKLIGHKPEVMRCPYGNNSKNLKAYAKEAGIPIAFWSVDTRDWESKNVNKIMEVSFGKNGIKDGSIVLLHDVHKTSVDASIKMMDRLIEEGYTMVTVPELIMAREGKINPGEVYY